MACKVLRCNHVSYTVRDINAVLPFFIQGLGFELVSLAPRDARLMARMTGVEGVVVSVAVLKGADMLLELIQYYAPADRQVVQARLCDAGLAHIGFEVDDVDAALAVAEATGFRAAGEAIAVHAGPKAGRRCAYVRNSDGLTVELVAATKSAPTPP